VMKILSALRSRWRIFFSWIYFKPKASWINHSMTYASERGFPSFLLTYKYFYRSPFSAFSITIQTLFPLTNDYKYLTT
jgi:hypothetical protein